MRQQRCGYNPWLDAKCHTLDGRTAKVSQYPKGNFVGPTVLDGVPAGVTSFTADPVRIVTPPAVLVSVAEVEHVRCSVAGVYVIFLYWRHQSALYEQQRSYISQVTHELKTPLASIQLHLETIRLRKPSQDKLERFLDTMLADTERLNHQINNILMAARLERRIQGTQHPVIDLSALVRRFMEQKRDKLPEGGSIILDIEDGVQVAADAEKLETALRNLFENAVLYSPASPEIRVSLRREGKNCLVTFADRGMGIEKRELRKIFRMFHRVRRPGENIRGTGLGLYIVSSVVREHHGRIRAESEGAGKGCTFIITLPLAGQKEGRHA